MTTEYKVLDLFSGCGGLSLGLHWAKSKKGSTFKTVAASDIWATASATYEQNLGISPYTAPISKELVKMILKDVGAVDIVVGGPPCQGFSTSGKRSLDDPRNQLVVAFLDAIAIAKPKAFLMENVSGFTTFQDGKLLEEVRAIAQGLGYTVRTGIVQASLVGVPQRRRRFMMVGILKGKGFTFPGETQKTSRPKIQALDVDLTFRDGEEEWTLWDAISDLPVVDAGESSMTYSKKPQNNLQKFLRADETDLSMHSAVNHKPEFVEMMSYIPQGKSALDPEVSETIPSAIRPKSGYPNSYSRLRPDQPAPTITRNFTTPSSANCIHPMQSRALTLREGARCQTFPDNYRFLGKPEEVRLQIGNAVPPLLAKAVGESILNCLETS
jgi:DNA (cytosine-5)-methyltransferase 1